MPSLVFPFVQSNNHIEKVSIIISCKIDDGKMHYNLKTVGVESSKVYVDALFTPNKEFIVSDSTSDEDPESGSSGSFNVIVTGYYRNGYHYFYKEYHEAVMSLAPGHSATNLVVGCRSGKYDDTYDEVGSWTYYDAVTDYARTTMSADIYYGFIYVGDIFLLAYVEPP